MKHYNNSYLVILYGKEVCQSDTLQGLAKQKLSEEDIVIIWNNGPKKLNHFDFEFNYKVINTVGNISLSVIYNKFVELTKSERYIFLDDDSKINDKYMNDINFINGMSIGIPKLTSNGQTISPIYNNVTRTNYFILSGLVFTRQTVDSLIDRFGCLFDTRFYFYGVDSTFSERLKRVPHIKQTEIRGFQHSLSNHNVESREVKEFRRKESAYCVGIYTRHYVSINTVLSTFRELVFRAIKMDLKWFVFFIKALFSGKHYKDTK
ncbi:hypothetical protein AB4379_16100 [Vibrio breoganii]